MKTDVGTDSVRVRKVSFDRGRCAAAKVLSQPTMEVEEVRRFAADELIVRVEREFASRLLDSVVAEWPADWWEALKDRWAPRWFLRRWPVRRRRVEMEARTYLRMAERAIPEDGPYVNFTIQEGR